MLRYAITNGGRRGATDAERTDALVEQAARLAARGDIDYLQLREKDLPAAALTALARRLLDALHTYTPDSARRPKLLINSRADVAIAVGADGVHLTSSPEEVTLAQVRSLYAEAGLLTPIISVSCHTLKEVKAARSAPADLILFGPVFEKRVGAQVIAEGSGLEQLRQACAAGASIPILALGGVTHGNTPECVAAGAAGIAGIRPFSV